MRLLYRIFNTSLRAAALLSMLWVVMCCAKVNNPGGEGDSFEPNFKLIFSVPKDTKATNTADYSDPMNNEGTDNLLKVDDLEIYFFTPDGSYVTCVKDVLNLRLSEDYTAPMQDRYHVYKAEMHVDGIVNGGVYRIVVIANRRSHLSGAFPFCTPMNDDWLETGVGTTDEEKLYSTLKFNYSSTGTAGVNAYIARNFLRDEMAYVPMWGFRQLTAQTRMSYDNLPVSGTIDLMRSVAKVKVTIAPDLLDVVELTDFNPVTSQGGIRVYNPVREGWMTPAYGKVKNLSYTPSIVNKDRVGGLPTGDYTNDWINKGESASESVIYPMYRHSDGSYYTYLPESNINESWLELEFRWKDESFATPAFHQYRMHFADYEDALAHYGLSSGVALTEAQLEKYKFPVMRNHYYVYTLVGLNPMELKFEVCEWQYRSTDIVFN